jgi:hypothetical protein
VEPVSPLFRARAFQYAVTKLAGSGFASDYSILMGGCSCKVDNQQMVSLWPAVAADKGVQNVFGNCFVRSVLLTD